MSNQQELWWSVPIFKIHDIFEFYRWNACWKSRRLLWLWFGVPDWSTQRIGFWNSLRTLRDQTIDTIHKKAEIKATIAGLASWHAQCKMSHWSSENLFSTQELMTIINKWGDAICGPTRMFWCHCDDVFKKPQQCNTWKPRLPQAHIAPQQTT